MMADPSRTPMAIITRNLTKHYGAITALEDLTLSVPEGKIYGFLGPNGAGKTTTIKLLMGFIKPTSGNAFMLGKETWRNGVEARSDLGFLVQPDSLFSDMSGNAHLAFAQQLSGRKSVLRPRLLEALELSQDALKRKLGSYSKGMRQKLALIAAIQHDPALLILDEPTDGLDPLIQRNFEEILHEIKGRGRTIFMSSHDLSEVERTCELVAVVRGGRLIAEQTVAGLKRLHRRRAVVQFVDTPPSSIGSIDGTTIIEREGNSVTFLIEKDVQPLLQFVLTSGIDDFTLSPPSLDDIFMGFYDTPGADSIESPVMESDSLR